MSSLGLEPVLKQQCYSPVIKLPSDFREKLWVG